MVSLRESISPGAQTDASKAKKSIMLVDNSLANGVQNTVGGAVKT
jgi:hypothetical protein